MAGRDRDMEQKHKSRRNKDEKTKKKKKHSRRDKEEKHKRRERKRRRYESDSSSESGSDTESPSPQDVVEYVLKEFPAVAGDLEQLLRMIDDGQAVDIRGLSERSLVKHLRRLSNYPSSSSTSKELDNLGPETDSQSVPPDSECGHVADDDTKKDSIGPRRRVIGPEMPSAELLAAAAKLTEAEAELRDAEVDGDTELFIGPPPPAVVMEAESANEAERFEEITRIIGAEEDSPYDILGVNKNMSPENMKKRYWKLSLMVHPDKCSHPQAHQAFVKLNKAFKDLQDPDKRKALDDKIKLKEEQESISG
ncbi:Chaperone protein DnaJ 2 [Sesamum alatum]|uniref:Chaperone protein DnaJ 2 n=1 Tax=Sesamum alatum TaxID=300844 RepID=A0AAE1XKW4_9LAMI|nr:Chaperone protein DnaJ 2 [Sesamum alatum]